MKKIMFILIMLSTLIIAGVLHGTHSLFIEEQEAITLTQAYMAQYPQTIPDLMFDQIPTNGPF